MKLARSSDKRLRSSSIDMPDNLGRRSGESSRTPSTGRPGIGQWPPRRLKGPRLRWMEALPGTLGGQLWGEGTIEPPSHGSPAIQSRFEVPRSKECPAVTQRRPWIRFGGCAALHPV